MPRKYEQVCLLKAQFSVVTLCVARPSTRASLATRFSKYPFAVAPGDQGLAGSQCIGYKKNQHQSQTCPPKIFKETAIKSRQKTRQKPILTPLTPPLSLLNIFAPCTPYSQMLLRLEVPSRCGIPPPPGTLPCQNAQTLERNWCRKGWVAPSVCKCPGSLQGCSASLQPEKKRHRRLFTQKAKLCPGQSR